MQEAIVAARRAPLLRIAVLAVAVLLTMTGCTGGGALVPPPGTQAKLPSIPPPTVVPGVGIVNMDTASFTVPIDAYAMSVRDINIVEAAHNVTFDLCFYKRGVLMPAEIAGVREWLTDTPESSRWFFGAWAAPFIAKNGWPGTAVDAPAMGPRNLPPEDVAAALACADNDPAVQEFVPSSPMYGFGSPAALQQYWGEGFGYAVMDQRFIDLTNQRNVCIVSKGYTVSNQPGDPIAQVDVLAGWTDEQVLVAEVAAAQCADDMNYTQQVVDIVAAYQLLTISQHEAELQAIKQSLDDLVAKANDVLKTYGII